MFEIAKNYTLTQHIYTDIPLVISDKTWGTLTPAYQKAFTDSARIAELYQRQITQEVEAQTMARLGSQGVTVIKIDSAPMRRLMIPYYKEFADKTGGPKLVDAVMATPA
jgi:TRAP-type C4-dicarboxylate transport system substrate-binding protein